MLSWWIEFVFAICPLFVHPQSHDKKKAWNLPSPKRRYWYTQETKQGKPMPIRHEHCTGSSFLLKITSFPFRGCVNAKLICLAD